jgi:hypothetical protein
MMSASAASVALCLPNQLRPDHLRRTGSDGPAQTALTAAAARAAHLVVDGPPVILADTLAAPLLGDRAEELIAYHRLHGDHTVLAGARAPTVERGRFTDDRLATAVREVGIRPGRGARRRPRQLGLPVVRWVRPGLRSGSSSDAGMEVCRALRRRHRPGAARVLRRRRPGRRASRASRRMTSMRRSIRRSGTEPTPCGPPPRDARPRPGRLAHPPDC